MKYGFLLGAFLSMILSTYPMPAGAQVRFTNTAVWPAYTRGEITALELGGNHLFAAIGIGGIAVLDVTDPRSPVRVASYQLGWASDIVVKDQYAYVIGSQGDGLRVLDITYPSAPHPVATNYMVGGERLYVDGNMLYVMASSHLGIVDISNRYDPRLIEFHPVSGGGQTQSSTSLINGRTGPLILVCSSWMSRTPPILVPSAPILPTVHRDL